ncbi:MAG: flagellar basal body L-ring protein FlgH [Desulfobacterales bacterium]|nr:flagellar basal body L-ring protein FlgH [Desulfobacterales bacterium]
MMMAYNPKKYVVVLLLLSSLFSGCGLFSKKTPDMAMDLEETKNRPGAGNQGGVGGGGGGGQELETLFEAMPAEEGSLWTDSGEMLFIDRRARRVGDTVVVDIVENATSSMDATTQTTKKSSVEANITNLMGFMRAAEALRRNLNRDENDNYVDKLVKAAYESDFEGTGASKRAGQIKASIGARVINVLPNGNLVIQGKRDLAVNNENQYITVKGIVRPEDIGADNRVQSMYLADASIVYSGKGVISDRQKPGWLSRLFDNFWPF